MSIEIAGTTVYTLEEIASRLQVSVATLRTYVDEGRLRASRVGRSFRVTAEALRDFLDPERPPSRPVGPPEDDPLLRVIGIGSDGELAHGIDDQLYD